VNANRVASSSDLLQALLELRAEAKTYNYGRSTIQTGIKCILDDSRYRLIVDDVQALNPHEPNPVSSMAYRFIASKRFDHSELTRLLQLDDDEINALMRQAAAGGISVFN
jgi:hypothetical protein